MVLDAFRLGGAETLIAQLARVADRADLELDVLSVLGSSEDRSKLAPMLVEAGVRPQYLGARRTVDPVAFARLVRRIRRDRPDVVHAHLEMAMTLALPAAALAGVPAVGTFHHVFRPVSGSESARERLAVEVATRSDAAVFVSRASLTSFAEHYRPDQPPPASWTVVHNGIDLDYYSPAPAGTPAVLPADLGLDGHRVVTIVAALRDFKGIGHAIRAWPAVADRHPDARLLLVGTGEEEPALRAEVDALGLGSRVVFAGMRSDIPAVLRGSDVALLPSVYGENLPTVLMEAGACARPVVASDVGGIRDIVADGETGLLVEPGDSAGLAAALTRLLDDPGWAGQLGGQGRRRVEQLFDARIWADHLRTLYERAIARRADGRRAA